MVGTRWESSSRPLFVRTVWKDGHHHVVLKKDEEMSTETARSARRNLFSGRSSKKTTASSPESHSGFKVPSVKLFLANLRTLKNDSRPKRCKIEPRHFLKSALTIDIIPSDSVRYSDLNKQVSFKNEKRLKFITKSKSVEANHFYNDNDSYFGTPPPFSYDSYCLDRFNTSLSERVMIWLDLAVQNQKEFKNVDLKKRVVTAQAYPLVEREKIIKHSEKTTRIEEKNEEVKIEEVAKTPLVTSRMECDHMDEVSVADKKLKVRLGTAKRQLHIFLPNLPKKSSDSGSFLSSKSSCKL